MLGGEHLNTATPLNNLALLLQDRGELASARPLFVRALAIREKMLGPEHPQTAQSLNNLAPLLQDLAAERSLHERALAIREKVLGPEHPETAQSLCNLAVLLVSRGSCGSAGAPRARVGDPGKVLGPEHPETVHSLNDLALLRRRRAILRGPGRSLSAHWRSAGAAASSIPRRRTA